MTDPIKLPPLPNWPLAGHFKSPEDVVSTLEYAKNGRTQSDILVAACWIAAHWLREGCATKELLEANGKFDKRCRLLDEKLFAAEARVAELETENERLRKGRGPQGYATWYDAAVDERIRRVKAEARVAELEEENERKQKLLDDAEAVMVRQRDARKKAEARVAELEEENERLTNSLTDSARSVSRGPNLAALWTARSSEKKV